MKRLARSATSRTCACSFAYAADRREVHFHVPTTETLWSRTVQTMSPLEAVSLVEAQLGSCMQHENPETCHVSRRPETCCRLHLQCCSV